jgi:7,8-dihydropterin-6-yl-methyl-4-(beta-D-ribofuranosyl)aminobenzene 5'-phosphate synthase
MADESVHITILVDNNGGFDLKGEHGFSLWIESENHKILFDTGQGPALPRNTRQLDVHLESADMMVLSHGHYDHTGGVSYVLRRNPKIHVYCHPAAVLPRYSIRNGRVRPIHMPQDAMAAVDRLSFHQIHWLVQSEAVSADMGITGPIPRTDDTGDVGGPFFLDGQGTRPDPIQDDQALWINTPNGLVICVGCCHAGLINTLAYIRRLTGVENIMAIVGGFHLFQADRQYMESTITRLQQLSPQWIIPCHCTGEAAVAALSAAFQHSVEPGYVGMQLVF